MLSPYSSAYEQGSSPLLDGRPGTDWFLLYRQYPDAVFNRISGILVDHSLVLPANVP